MFCSQCGERIKETEMVCAKCGAPLAISSPPEVRKASAKKGLLIVLVAGLCGLFVFAIIVAISLPGFLEFQTRAKVSRVKSDHRAIATAIEAYYVDFNEYPAMAVGDGDQIRRHSMDGSAINA